MEEQDLYRYVMASAHRALAGVITPNLRQVSASWDGFRSFTMRVCYDSAPTEDEVEEMEIVTTNIAADIPFEYIAPVDVVLIGDAAPGLLHHIIYSRE